MKAEEIHGTRCVGCLQCQLAAKLERERDAWMDSSWVKRWKDLPVSSRLLVVERMLHSAIVAQRRCERFRAQLAERDQQKFAPTIAVASVHAVAYELLAELLGRLSEVTNGS